MYYSDTPINSVEDDVLGRSNFAHMLAKTFLQMNADETFAVGLFGPWGSGKTSLVNMTLNQICEEQRQYPEEAQMIVIHFEPWAFSDTNQLLMQFFTRLSNELSNKNDKRLAQIGAAIDQYSGAFELAKGIPYVGELVSLLGKRGITSIAKRMQKGADEKDILKKKEYIIELLKKQSHKILIVIDDIDRLNSEQIRQVFQLVASVARFPKTIYLLVFDKNIVAKALEKMQEGSGEDYLEKIIQVPIQIPDVQGLRLYNVLFDKLDKIIVDYKIVFQQDYWLDMFEPCIAPLIHHIRDVNRLCNALEFKLSSISEEVNFTDMVALTALELHYPQVYAWIKENKIILTGGFNLSQLGQKEKTSKEWYEYYASQLPIQEEQDREQIMEFISKVFPYFGQKTGMRYEAYNTDTLRRDSRVAHGERFDRYFDLEIDNVSIKRADVISAISFLSTDELTNCLKKHEAKGEGIDFLEEIKAWLPQISPERAEIIFRAIVKVAEILSNRNPRGLMYIPSNYFAASLLIELLDIILEEKRYALIKSILSNADDNTVSAIAYIIQMLDSAYGRYTENGNEQNYKKVISVDELIQLEQNFSQRVKELLQVHTIFEFKSWERIKMLLERFDEAYISDYFGSILKNDANVLKFLQCTITTWIGGTKQYEINPAYQKYLTKERIIASIERERELEEFYSFPEETINLSIAFYLATSKSDKEEGNILQADVNECLNKWREQYMNEFAQ